MVGRVASRLIVTDADVGTAALIAWHSIVVPSVSDVISVGPQSN